MMKLGVAIAVLAACSKPSPHAGLAFIEDDLAKARADAVAHELPLFVEVAAPW